jgi:hypothetical protein
MCTRRCHSAASSSGPLIPNEWYSTPDLCALAPNDNLHATRIRHPAVHCPCLRVGFPPPTPDPAASRWTQAGGSRRRRLQSGRSPPRGRPDRRRYGDGPNTHPHPPLLIRSRWRPRLRPSGDAVARLVGVAVHLPGRDTAVDGPHPAVDWRRCHPRFPPHPPPHTHHSTHPPISPRLPCSFPPYVTTPRPRWRDAPASHAIFLPPFSTPSERRLRHSSGYFGSRRSARSSERSTTVRTSPS